MKYLNKTKFALVAIASVITSVGAMAQSAYPCPTVKIISPYPPAGTTDILSRLLAPGLSKELGTTVIVENKAGASSNIGTEYVANAPPDGCTLLLGNNTGVVINRNLYKLRTDPVKGLTPVIEVASVPLVLYVNTTVPATNLNQLVDEVKKNPGKYSYASGGSGSPQHLMGEMLKLEKQLDITHIPYKGQGPALADVIAGQVQMAFETTTAIAAQLNSGRIRPLATTGSVRTKGLENVPTMKELGYNNFVIENWYGIFAPAKTPAPLVQRLNQELNKVMKSPEVAASLAKMGSSDVAGSAEQFNQFVQKELPYWESLVKRSGAKVD
ncbi:tricarboxylate-binding receptor [Limnohabitans sp. TS-CS-82]|jgi:tripartite-type tricarboxylate transporter receptor subunit TctC|uniref:Bug family tripartite tricarboxylate transporter substrate binding protein n=1 Tax=Limnohabitans sp. TS-CS-82 TaxID=2094193 RepID=UPI000CF2058C|nr:tripartite tricarboxylate transporter substrate binding protein [Limnohabitans sp. TS-CS-82]PQA81221.1 tricarboxylate-binding receptor [Limnohabitans sp. TS-CS-82]